MDLNEQKKLIADFISKHDLVVVASMWDGAPQAAAVRYSEHNQFEIIFGTYNTTRKYRNLKKDPKVALVFGEGDEMITVQYEGIAHEQGGDLKDECRKIHLAKNPSSEKYSYVEQQRYFKVVPVWIRYTDISMDPELVFEVTF